MSMAAARARAVKTMDRQRGNPDLAMGRFAWPDDAAKRAANYRNQFEAPVLFYAVVAFALITKGADTLMIVLAWLFVLTRIVHAAIHIGPNKVRWRSPAFALGFLIVALMWIKLALHVATRRDRLSRHAAGRPHQGRHRGARRRAGAASPGSGGARRLGQEPPLRRLRGSGRPSATSSTTPCAAAGRWLPRWTPTPPGRSPWRQRRMPWGSRLRAVIASADGSAHAVEPLSEAEQAALSREVPADAPPSVRGDFPDWLEPSLARAFGGAAAEEGAALARRAPVDLRVNTLKADRDKVLKALARFAPEPTPLSPVGVRLAGSRRVQADSPTSRPRPGMGGAGTRCRTRARRSPP